MSLDDRLVRITDPADPRIRQFGDIRERDLRRTHGQFIAEGTVVLRLLADAARRGGEFGAEAVFLLENRVAGLAEVIAAFPEHVPVYVADRGVMNAVVGFDIHRGVLALGRRAVEPTIEARLATLSDHALVVAAIGIANHDNIGAIFRNAAAFGADAVLLDETCCDPLYRKALRVSVGAALKIPYARAGSAADLISALDRRGFAVWGLSPSGGHDIREIGASRRMALLTGTEGEGLPPEVMKAVRTARIPQAPGLDSLNAGVATGVALFAIASAMGRI
ncbi:TrmH family RNA methyltransferase [Rhizobium sp. TRM95796]|uniref:TrmH family RNA methyltransferase n=1 Tax=Rhizobium sp. TRM95796 TaxID=2979862 RepID=UPI0021E9776F|nr:RNA methyltransferase [Rhizobium sp. TRM95796]MCV3766031.1 RNA methyltransferase [Rhizobium sp. TRM95796]